MCIYVQYLSIKNRRTARCRFCWCFNSGNW